MAEAIGSNEFQGEGRGPELVCLRWSADGRSLLAAEYRNAADPSLRHVAFQRVQVVMTMPEEVVGDNANWPEVSAHAVNLGHSQWVKSFNPEHLGRCSHFRLEFYDETLDVICEGVEFGWGPFAGAVA